MRSLRGIVVGVLLLFALLLCSAPARAGEGGFPGANWQHIAPAQAGWSEVRLAEARAFSAEIRSSAVFIVQHGKVVAEWGDTAKPMELASVRKSLLSALIGIAVADHLINLDSTLGELGIDDNPPALTDVEKTATVRELLEARSGVYHLALYETPGMAKTRPPRGSHAPGSFWYYNNWDFNVLGTIYEHATGIGIFDALDQKLARPIGMQDYRPQDGSYVRGEASIHPAYPIRMSARDLARFALLYLNSGNWAGRQIVPQDWVQESTRAYSRSPYGPGYGYLWWTDFLDGAIAPTVKLPEGSYMAQGAGGQYALVMPALDLVVVHRVDRDLPYVEPSPRDIARLLWLILKAQGYDAGPDASLAAAGEERPIGEALKARILGKTLSFGATLKDGPLVMRLEGDGHLTYLHWNDAFGPQNGTWTVTNDQLCLHRDETRCYIATFHGDRIKLFDRYGVMQIDAVATPQ
jgi:CubicO group peptidase (beta-lactamase class C family)